MLTRTAYRRSSFPDPFALTATALTSRMLVRVRWRVRMLQRLCVGPRAAPGGRYLVDDFGLTKGEEGMLGSFVYCRTPPPARRLLRPPLPHVQCSDAHTRAFVLARTPSHGSPDWKGAAVQLRWLRDLVPRCRPVAPGEPALARRIPPEPFGVALWSPSTLDYSFLDYPFLSPGMPLGAKLRPLHPVHFG
jgi:hypothetical protein